MAVKPETDEPSETASEETSTQDDELDSLLNEWEPEKPQKTEAKPPASDPMLQDIYNRMANDDLTKAVDRVYSNLDDLPARPAKGIIRDALDGRAGRSKAIQEAWTQRHNDPDKWDKIVDAFTNDFKKQFEVKEKETETVADREAAAAYVRGSSTKEVPPEPVDSKKLANMTDKEFMEFQRKEYGV